MQFCKHLKESLWYLVGTSLVFYKILQGSEYIWEILQGSASIFLENIEGYTYRIFKAALAQAF